TARLRELGLLRCAGATRRQVTGLVLLEAAGLGLVGALGGMTAGLVVGAGLLRGRELVAAQALPAHPLVVRAPTVLAAVAFGVGVTVLGALAAAIRAGRVAPLVALRDLGEPVTPDSSRPARRRIRWAVLLAGAGVLVAVLGLRFAFAGLPLVLGGGMLLFLGTVVAAPVLVPGLLAGPERVAGRFLGPVAELVVTSARRDPRRVAATGTALMIGVALMAMFGVLLATARDQSGRELEENFPVAYVLDQVGLDGRPDPVPRPLPAELTAALRADPAFASVTEVRTTLTTDRLRVWAVPAEQLRGPVRPEVTAGDLAGLRPGAVAVSRKLAAARGVGPGDRLDLGGLGTVVVVALYDDSPVDGAVLVSWEQFTAGYGPGAPDRLLLDLAPGLDPAAGRRAVDAAVRSHPLVRVNSLAERTAALTGTLDELLGIFTAVLGLSVLIALLGIGNTMSLAVVERTGEFRAMRAQGLSRRQLAGLVLAEAALVGVVGAVGGVILGGAVGWVAATGLIDS
ncbi:MAG TPA: ABC transporter permease, partial [Micromonospora sp.]